MSERELLDTGLRAATVEAGAAYEFLLTLHAITCLGDFEAYSIGRDWFEDARAAAGIALCREIERFAAGCDTLWDHLLGLASTAPDPRDVPALLGHLEATSAVEIRLHLLGYYDRACRRTTPAPVILRAAEGDPEAQNLYLHTASLLDDIPWQAALRRLLAHDAVTIKSDLLAIVYRWDEAVFHQWQTQVMPQLQTDAQAKRTLAKRVSPQRLVALAASGYDYTPEPGVQRVLVIPSRIMHPWLIRASLSDTHLICYPVASSTGDGTANDAPPDELVQLYKALGDERRLHILKKLAAESATLQELSDLFAIGKTTMLHHLVILRGAGLVDIHAHRKRYHLCASMLPQAAQALERYLDLPSATASRSEPAP